MLLRDTESTPRISMLNSSILVLFFEYFFSLSAHLSSTFFLVGTKKTHSCKLRYYFRQSIARIRIRQ
jgi:hypothetical protein